ncbi:uncharacterized protein ACNLHF_014941 isoform 2-T2 [Anomaloglossus baeobatrachus]|uniref:uncharacterized protein LOC142304199 isoform X2 n=1 Tax=Anomaloglossus baeobatrachus TaxID=238106 RepID=UPI003F4FE1C5
MEAGRWGRPAYRFSRPPMNFRGNGPRHIRPLFHYGHFADTFETPSDSFMGGFESFDQNVVTRNKRFLNKNIAVYRRKAMKQEEKGKPQQKMNASQSKPSKVNKPQQQQKMNASPAKPQQQQKMNASQSKPSEGAAKKLNRQAHTALAKNPQQPEPQGVSQPANAVAKKEKRPTTENGGDAGESTDADAPTQPHKKVKMEETTIPTDVPIDEWQGDTSTMFSCNLCQYNTHDEREMQVHFYSSQHKEVLNHLYIFYPRQRVDFLHNYLLFKKRKMSLERKNNHPQPFKDKFIGIGQEHFLHRIQAAQCQACNVLIPDVQELLRKHISSDDHQQNCKARLKNIKVKSLAATKELLLDQDILHMLKMYQAGKNPFRDLAVYSSQAGNAPEVLVAEEDDEDANAIDDDDDEYFVADDTNDEDAVADGKEDPDNKDSAPTMPVNSEETDEEEEEEEAAEAP